MKNPFVPEDVNIIRSGQHIFSGSLLLADISGFTELTERLGTHGKKGTEDLTDLLNSYFDSMFTIVREYGGIIISSAGDSILARFTSATSSKNCAKKMMKAIGKFENIETDTGMCQLDIKIIIGSGTWNEFIVGNDSGAHIFLAGDLIEKISRIERTAQRGEISFAESKSIPRGNNYRIPDIPETSFPGPGSEKTYGEHRSIVAMFLNIRGYDEENPPFEQLQDLYLDVARIAGKYKGFVQLIDNILSGGSRMFLLFGAPLSSGNETVNAVCASMELREILVKNDLFETAFGINEGYAFAGTIGNDWSRQYTVIGDVVNTAARLADSADSDGIIVSEGVYRITKEEFEFRDLECIHVKGKMEPLKRFSPHRKKREIMDRYSFVGRTAELQEISDLIKQKNTIIELTGTAGIGKTSLLRELMRLLSEKGYSVLHGTCIEHSRANHLFASILGNLSGIRENDSQNSKKEKLRKFLTGLDRSDSDAFLNREVFLGRMLFFLDYPPSTYDVLPPRLRRENLLDGICEIIQAFEDPVCIIFEDIHYSQVEDLEAIKYIARTLLNRSGTEVSFILSKRPDDRDFSFKEGIPLHGIQLGGLKASDSDKLLLEILDGKRLESTLEQMINSRAEGNPFYLMQILLYLIEKDLIKKADQTWVRTDNYSDDKLPGNIFSMVMARIDRLEERAKECLKVGSVIGPSFSEEIVQKVLLSDVHANLQASVEVGLVYISVFRELEYIFSHILIKDVAYDSILRKRRKVIHGKIGSILEEIYSDRKEDFSSVLAHHFSLSEKWEKALEYSISAGARAWSEYRNQNSIEHYEMAIRILQEELQGRHDELANCFYHLAEVEDRLGDYDSALEHYNKVLELSSDISLHGSAGISIADVYYIRGEIDRAIDLLDDVERKLKSDLDEHQLLELRIGCFRAWTYCVQGNIDSAMKEALKALNLSETLTHLSEKKISHRLGHVYNTIATVHWAASEYSKAREYYVKALQIARKHGMKREAAVTFGNIGLVSEKMGRFDEAIESFSKQLSFSREIGDKLIILTSYGELAGSYCSTGQFTKALENAESYRVLAEEVESLHDILLSYNHLGLIHLATGDLDKAAEYAETAYERSKDSAFEREEGASLYLLGRIAFENENYARAEKYLNKADELARKVQSKSLLQYILISLADLKMHDHQFDECWQLLNEAESLIEDMGIRIGQAMIYQRHGKLYAALDEYDKSNTAFDKAVTIFEELKAKPDLADTLHAYGNMLLVRPNASSEDRDRGNQCILLKEELYREMRIIHKKS